MKLIIMFTLITISYVSGVEKKKWLNYVLLWTNSRANSTFAKNLGQKQDGFIRRECPFQNCIVTTDAKYLKDVSDFDAILFVGSELDTLSSVPQARAEHQKYVFVSRKPAAAHPVKTEYDSFFNWTWTYKLNSDIRSLYFIVKNKKGVVIGPKQDMHWIKLAEMKPTSKHSKRKLLEKKIAAIWFASAYATSKTPESYGQILRKELINYNQELRICGKENMNDCLIHDKDIYYFYIAFEDSMCEDYVTERVFHALQHFTVPIVLGGANYSRFLPANSYLDATEHSPSQLAKIINDIINDKEAYYDYFRWHKYYSFHDTYESKDTDDYCAFCTLLNDEGKRMERSVYTNFVQWWNEPLDWPKEWYDGRHLQNPVTKFKVVKDYKAAKQSKNLIQIPEALRTSILSHSNQEKGENNVNTIFPRFQKMVYNLFDKVKTNFLLLRLNKNII